MPIWAQIVLGLLGAGTIGSLIALLRVAHQNAKDASAERKDDADAESTRAATSDRLFSELEKIRGDCLELKDENAQCRRENADLKRENAEMMERITVLERHAVAARLEEFNPVACAIMDRANEGWVFSQLVDGEPRLTFVNRYFAKRLGRSPVDVLVINWRGLVHPDDEHNTEEAARSALHGNLIDFPNRFLHADGSWIPILWTAAKVDPTGRGTFALAQFSERRIEL